MTLEMKPLGNSCNLACTYCYQEPMRLSGNVRASKSYDIDLMMSIGDDYAKERDSKEGYTMFGGEALLVPIKDLEVFFKSSHEKYGRSSIQTNGSLITDKHIELFKKYNVNVGISFDGPNDLNSLRVSVKGDYEKAMDNTMENLKKLAVANVQCGSIITVHKKNGRGEELTRLMNYIRWLGNMGIKHGNLHMMEVDSPTAALYCLSKEDNEKAFLELAEFFHKEENRDLYYDPFRELPNMLSGKSQGNCVWTSCDPHNTQAVFGIEGNGQLSNCGMVNKDGMEWTKPTQHNELSYVRDLLLYETPEEYGGCKGCPFFTACNGYCPGSAIDSDWRNKTVHCNAIKALMRFYEEKVEEEGIVPITKRADSKEKERMYIRELARGNRMSIPDLYKDSPSVVQVKGE